MDPIFTIDMAIVFIYQFEIKLRTQKKIYLYEISIKLEEFKRKFIPYEEFWESTEKAVG